MLLFHLKHPTLSFRLPNNTLCAIDIVPIAMPNLLDGDHTFYPGCSFAGYKLAAQFETGSVLVRNKTYPSIELAANEGDNFKQVIIRSCKPN